ncbi:MAG: hypothetical protein KKH08_03770, partial [Candidatus Omnitrophica bacterium]|nr:hypothetical protein [Candidatus Omnitrophota bacterium]
MGKYFITALLVLACATMAYAAPVGLTSEADLKKAELWADKEIGITAAIIYDAVTERKIDFDGAEFEMNAALARIGVSILDRFNVYVDVGQATDMEYKYVIQGEKYTAKFDDELMYGVGVNALIYRWDNGLEIGASANYRIAEMNIDKVTIDSNTYQKNDLTEVQSGDYEETQVALEVAYKTEYFAPYLGVKYSEVDLGTKFTAGGAERDASGQSSQEVIG